MTKPITRVELTCPVCEAKFERVPSHIEGRSTVCCSLPCTNEMRRRLSGERPPSNAFALRDDASRITERVVDMVQRGASGGEITTQLEIGRGALAGILKREGLRIKKGACLPKQPNTACDACKKALYRTPSEMHETNFCDKQCVAAFLSQDIKRVCVQCEASFTVPSHATPNKCCSYKCSVAYRTKSVERACQTCGVMFMPRGPSSKTKFCSKKCFAVSMYKRVRMACEQCGKEEDVPTCHAERNSIYTCSWDCSLLFRNSNEQYRLQRNKNTSLAIRKKWEEDEVWAKSQRLKLSEMNMRRLKECAKGPTSAEVACARILESLDIEYEEQYGFRSMMFERSKCYDFYLPDSDTLVEVHGTFWHADPRVYPDRENLSDVQRANIDNDEVKEIIAREEMSKKLLIVWEKDLHEEPLKVAALFEALA